MQPTMCSRCGKNVAVIFITKLEGGSSKNEGLCLVFGGAAPCAALDNPQAARHVDLAPNGSALLANAQQAWLYIPSSK